MNNPETHATFGTRHRT